MTFQIQSVITETIEFYQKLLGTISAVNRVFFAFLKLMSAFAYRKAKEDAHLWECQLAESYPQTVPKLIPNYETHHRKNVNTKKVAVVVPTLVHDEKRYLQLKRLVDSLIDQTVFCEIIIVDDGSTMTLTFHDITVIKLDKNRVPAVARNIGAQEAIRRGCDWIAFTDSDCIPDRNWIHNMLQTVGEKPFANVIAGRACAYQRTVFDQFQNLAGTLNPRHLDHTGQSLLYGCTCNLFVSSHTLKWIEFCPLFRSAAFEDIDFCAQARRLGHSIEFADAAIVRHDFDYGESGIFSLFKNIGKIVNQYYRYGEWEWLMVHRHPEYCGELMQSTPVQLLH